MANVFGNTITNSTLEGMPEYVDKVITRKDRARVALDMKNTGDKDAHAQVYVEGLKRESGDGVSTKCLIYNATGDTVTFMKGHDWYGNIGTSPYPMQIANGQWGVFLHVKKAFVAQGSSAAVVYRGMNQNGDSCDWMLSWSNPWNRLFNDNTVFSEIREAGYYDTDYWDGISSLLYKSGKYHTVEWNECTSTVTTGTGTTVVFEAVMTLKNV